VGQGPDKGSGNIKAYRLGKKIVILVSSLRDFLDNREMGPGPINETEAA
jgi:hypothetical protein